MSGDRVRQHYELEKRLAQRILTSSQMDRSRIVRESYDEVYRTITWHPDLLGSPERVRAAVRAGMALYSGLIRPHHRVLEIGCGQGHLAAALAGRHRQGWMCATDVSAVKLDTVSDGGAQVRFLSSEGSRLPFSEGSFDLAISSQVVEHLHPCDVQAHLSEVWRVLRSGGRYAFDTPNGLTGPYDVSRGFDAVATGFHLKEWTYGELIEVASSVGFKKGGSRSDWPVWGPIARRLGQTDHASRPAAWLKLLAERVVARLPRGSTRERVGRALGVSAIFLVLEKP